MIDVREQVRRGRMDVCLPATSGLVLKRDLLARILPMPSDVYDNYIKIAAVALAPALLIPDRLAGQRIHEQNFYTGQSETEAGRIRQALVGVRTAYRIRARFPFLSVLAWKQFGRCLQVLVASKLPDAKKAIATVWTEYNIFEWSPRLAFYVGTAFARSYMRSRLQRQRPA